MTTIRVYIATLGFVLFAMTQLFYGCASQPGAAKDVDQAQPSELRTILSVTASESAEAAYVVISADGPLTFSSLKKPDPPAVLLVFPETSVAQLPAEQLIDGQIVQRIVASDGNGGRTARLELELATDQPYTASKEGNNVRLTFAKTAMAKEAVDTTTATPAVAVAPRPTVEASTATQAAPVSVPKTTAWVNKIDFLSESQGKSTLVVGTTHAINYQVQKISPQKIEIRLLNTRIPSYRQRALITTRFTSAVDRIVPFQHARTANESVISVELREAVPYFTEQADNLLLVHFEASSVPPKPMEQAHLPAWKRASSYDVSEPVMSAPMGAAPRVEVGPADAAEDAMAISAPDATAPGDRTSSLLRPQKRYSGEKIAIDFYDTDIKNVFRILREVSGKNFAIDKNVTGKVTMTLETPVPWDQVLDLVLRMNQLGLIYEGDIVRIATQETLKKEDDLHRSKLESKRKAQDEARALEPLVTKYIPVSYSDATSEVIPHLEKILTKDRGSVTVDTKNNQVIITDTASVVRMAQEIVRRIDRVTSQVLIEARVVEVSDTFARSLGIIWGASYGPGVIPGSGIETTADMAINLPSAANNTVGINFSRLSGVPFVLNAKLDAVENTGEGRILSSPKILTLDNKKAQIKQGLEYPYEERSSDGGTATKFKNIDLMLEVTPHVTPDNRVSLKIKITKNDVAGFVGSVPSVATNEAETELLVNDGDTIVIGGIIKTTENKSQAGIPALSKIPVLGWLFKNTTRSHQKNELLIFISPSIVQLEQARTGQ
jgi:type IV pilus assembly protein PilQ